MEVELEDYQFVATKEEEEMEGMEFEDLLNNDNRRSKNDDPATDSVAFHHNPIHDAESLWWICVMALFKMRVVLADGAKLDNTNFAEQMYTASQIFPTVSANLKRQNFLKTNRFFEDCMETLHPSLSKIAKILRLIRKKLLSIYRDAEKDLPERISSAYNYRNLNNIAALFKDGMDEAQGMELEDFPQEWFNELHWNESRVQGFKRRSTDQSDARRYSKTRRYVNHDMNLYFLYF